MLSTQLKKLRGKMSKVELEIKRTPARCPQCKEPLDDWSKMIYTKAKGKRYYCDECEMIVITKPPKTKPRGYRRIEVM